MRVNYIRCIALSSTVGFCLLATGCTPAEKVATFSAMQSAFNTLTQNRSLAEQFVSDIKTSVAPTDPAYTQARENYEEAKDAYNRYLDQVELGTPQARGLSTVDTVANDAQSGITDFLSSATKALQPNAVPSRSMLRRAAPLPPELGRTLAKVPRNDRKELVEQLDSQVRWRSWGEL